MGHISHEPSMEEILSSIKRIIAEDGSKSREASPAGNEAAAPEPQPHRFDEDEQPASGILELTNELPPTDHTREPEPTRVELPADEEGDGDEPQAPVSAFDPGDLVSSTAATASRQALASLSKLIVRPEPDSDGTLEGMVREMLRPMLKDWLDANLPELVETMVAKEIARITGKAF